jgi:hypothetical protein
LGNYLVAEILFFAIYSSRVAREPDNNIGGVVFMREFLLLGTIACQRLGKLITERPVINWDTVG